MKGTVNASLVFLDMTCSPKMSQTRNIQHIPGMKLHLSNNTFSNISGCHGCEELIGECDKSGCTALSLPLESRGFGVKKLGGNVFVAFDDNSFKELWAVGDRTADNRVASRELSTKEDAGSAITRLCKTNVACYTGKGISAISTRQPNIIQTSFVTRETRCFWMMMLEPCKFGIFRKT
jgi:hypothetical protein